jgi:AcrR family transcriptional regulator
MRVRTAEKRREIVECAAALFVEQGYDRASMSAISERVGGSKATLYGYFPSKEALLHAVLEHDVSTESRMLAEAFPSGDDLAGGLARLGARYLAGRLADLPIANLRTVANQPPGSTIGADFYAGTLRPAWQRLADHFAALMDAGQLRLADPWLAAMHWKGLNEGELLEKRLLGAVRNVEPAEIDRVATAAAEAFLAIYGPRPAGASHPAAGADAGA